MRGGIAERGGVRVGHRIIEINGQSVVATAHEKIVQALSNSVGEVRGHCLKPELGSRDPKSLGPDIKFPRACRCTGTSESPSGASQLSWAVSPGGARGRRGSVSSPCSGYLCVQQDGWALGGDLKAGPAALPTPTLLASGLPAFFCCSLA